MIYQSVEGHGPDIRGCVLRTALRILRWGWPPVEELLLGAVKDPVLKRLLDFTSGVKEGARPPKVNTPAAGGSGVGADAPPPGAAGSEPVPA